MKTIKKIASSRALYIVLACILSVILWLYVASYANTDMDYSEAAQRLYRRPVPPFLRDISLEDSGVKSSGDSMACNASASVMV